MAGGGPTKWWRHVLKRNSSSSSSRYRTWLTNNIVMRNRQEQPQNLWFQTRLSTVSDRYKVFTPWEQARLHVLYLDLSVTTKRWFQSNGYKVIRLYISICDRAILQWYRKLEDSSCCSRCFTVIGSPNALFFCSCYKGLVKCTQYSF